MKSYDLFKMLPAQAPLGAMGHDWCAVRGLLPDPLRLGATHAYAGMTEAPDLNDLVLSRPALGLRAGDVVVSEDGAAYLVDSNRRLHRLEPGTSRSSATLAERGDALAEVVRAACEELNAITDNAYKLDTQEIQSRLQSLRVQLEGLIN